MQHETKRLLNTVTTLETALMSEFRDSFALRQCQQQNTLELEAHIEYDRESDEIIV